MSCFQENLQLLFARAPGVAKRVAGTTPSPWTPQPVPLNWDEVDVHCLYGVSGLSNPTGPLVVIEHDPSQWVAWLHQTEAASVLKNESVAFCYPEEIGQVSIETASKRIEVSASNTYRGSERFQEIRSQLFSENHSYTHVMEEYLSYLPNFYANLSELHRARLATDLNFAGKPAIICGAGPSLDVEALRPLKGHALLFAPGTALNLMGDLADFGVGVDPNDGQYNRIMTNRAYETPYFYTSRWNKRALRAVHGPLYYVPTGHIIDQRMGFEGLDEGHSSATLTLALAQKLGCNPIVLTGMDLSYNDDSNVGRDPVTLQPDLHGRSVKTHWRWVAEARWIADFAKAHPETTFLNATNAGLGFEGIPNVPLPAFPEEISVDLDVPPIDTKAVPEIVQELSASLERCAVLLEQSMTALNQVELESEMAWEAFVEPIRRICKDPKQVIEAHRQVIEIPTHRTFQATPPSLITPEKTVLYYPDGHPKREITPTTEKMWDENHTLIMEMGEKSYRRWHANGNLAESVEQEEERCHIQMWDENKTKLVDTWQMSQS